MINVIDFVNLAHWSGYDVDCFRVSGIYVVKNLVNGHCYVGSSCRVLVRGRKHLTDLKSGNHHCEPLQRAFNKYPSGSFVFGLLEVVEDRNNLQDVEQKWIDSDGYYNTSKSAKSPAGVKMSLSDDERNRRRERALSINASRSKQQTEVNIAKANAARLATPVSSDTREKISVSLKGRQFSEEHREKIRVARSSNPENFEKNIEAARRLNECRRNMTPEQVAAWKQKLRQSRLGKTLSDEHKAKIKAGMSASLPNP